MPESSPFPPPASGPASATRRTLLIATGAGALAATAPGVLAQGRWPERPIRLVVPFPPGGNSDVLGRTLADRLREVLPATVVVDNRPGGTTQVGTDAVARAEPDGYTMLLAEPQTRDKLQRASIVAQWTPPDPYRAALHKGRGIYGDLLRSIGMKQDGA